MLLRLKTSQPSWPGSKMRRVSWVLLLIPTASHETNHRQQEQQEQQDPTASGLLQLHRRPAGRAAIHHFPKEELGYHRAFAQQCIGGMVRMHGSWQLAAESAQDAKRLPHHHPPSPAPVRAAHAVREVSRTRGARSNSRAAQQQLKCKAYGLMLQAQGPGPHSSFFIFIQRVRGMESLASFNRVTHIKHIKCPAETAT